MGKCGCHFLSKEVLFQGGPVVWKVQEWGLGNWHSGEMYFGAISKQKWLMLREWRIGRQIEEG